MAASEIATLDIVDDEMPEIASRIMFEAIKLFGRKGYAATSVREIVQAAKVTNPMLYYYFESKEGLFHRTIRALFDHRHDQIRELVQSDLAFAQKLRSIVVFHVVTLREKPEVLSFVYAVIFGPKESRPDIDLLGLVARDAVLLEAMFTEARETGEFVPRKGWAPLQLAEAFYGVIGNHMMRAMALMAGSHEDSALVEELTGDAAIDQMIDFFMNGVALAAPTRTQT